MANFIFSEGAALAAGAGLDWVSTAYELCPYDDTVSPVRASTWATIGSGVVAAETIPSRTLTTAGACAGGPVTFNGISPTTITGFLKGLIIKRASDDLLIAHIDTGLVGLNIQAPALTYTFTVKPGANSEQAYFRL
jgi:hypothetical protein